MGDTIHSLTPFILKKIRRMEAEKGLNPDIWHRTFLLILFDFSA